MMAKVSSEFRHVVPSSTKRFQHPESLMNRFTAGQGTDHEDGIFLYAIVELVAKPHRHFLNVIMMQANWKKATNIPI
jgi:hypothetical protein